MTDVAQIVAGLTKAQRAYLTDYAKWRSPAIGHAERWMTFPPSSTHGVLCRLGLTDRSGQILEPGLAVRTALLSKEGESADDR